MVNTGSVLIFKSTSSYISVGMSSAVVEELFLSLFALSSSRLFKSWASFFENSENELQENSKKDAQDLNNLDDDNAKSDKNSSSTTAEDIPTEI
jgi:hypothetical protein